MNNKIGIITARGGSKRIPRKNIRPFLGKPIISYSIQAAIDSGLFSEIMVSTDDQEIAEISKACGANVPFMRSSCNSNDVATTADVLIEVVTEYAKLGLNFDNLCCLYPAAPFVTANMLKESFDHMLSSQADGCVPVVRFSHPIQRAFAVKSDHRLSYIWPENRDRRSQDLAPTFHDAGQFYWIRSRSLLDNRSLITENTVAYVLEEYQVQDIDNESDWKVAEQKVAILKRT